MSTDEQPWLTPEQQVVWRAWLEVSASLPVALGRDLQRRADLSLPDFDVLVQLSEHPEGRLRAAALAEALHWERSRLSHHVARMRRRGLVGREECLDDGRGSYVVLTPRGRTAIEGAAPDHAALVRELFVEALTPDETRRLGRALGRVAERLAAHQDGVESP